MCDDLGSDIDNFGSWKLVSTINKPLINKLLISESVIDS